MADSLFGTGNLIGQEQWARRGENDARIAANTIPVGVINAYAGTAAPAGWLLCDGSSFSSTSYPTLAALLGSTTLPDLRQRFPMGKAAAGTGSTLGGTGGSKDAVAVTHNHTQDAHNHTQDAHGHTVNDPQHHHAQAPQTAATTASTVGLVATGTNQAAFTNAFNTADAATGVTANNGTATNQGATATNQSAGSSGTDANLPPWLAVNYIIRAA